MVIILNFLEFENGFSRKFKIITISITGHISSVVKLYSNPCAYFKTTASNLSYIVFYDRIQCMILCVSNDVLIPFTFTNYAIFVILKVINSNNYGLTTFETPVAALITLLRLRRCLWGFEREEKGCDRGRVCCRVRGRVFLLSFPFILCAFFFLVFGVYLASACFGYFDMVQQIDIV